MFKGKVTDIFFDLDHTLWDFDKNSALTFEKILVENNVHVELSAFLDIYMPVNQEYWKLYRNEQVTKEELRYLRLKKTFETMGVQVSDNLIDVLAEEYIGHLSSFNHVLPDTVAILEYLKPTYKLHIITNGFQEIQDKKLKNAQIYAYFDKIINSEMAGVKKPNPKIFQLALENARVLPEKALMIGDNIEADILGAKAVGLHALHFNVHDDPVHNHSPIINALSEIKSIL